MSNTDRIVALASGGENLGITVGIETELTIEAVQPAKAASLCTIELVGSAGFITAQLA